VSAKLCCVKPKEARMSMDRLVSGLKKMNFRFGIALLGLSLLLTGAAVAQEVGAGDHAAQTVQAETAASNHWIPVSAFIAAALVTGLGSLAAGMAVSNVGSAAMGAVAERPELMGKSLIYVALAEGIAIYGLLIAIIILAKV